MAMDVYVTEPTIHASRPPKQKCLANYIASTHICAHICTHTHTHHANPNRNAWRTACTSAPSPRGRPKSRAPSACRGARRNGERGGFVIRHLHVWVQFHSSDLDPSFYTIDRAGPNYTIYPSYDTNPIPPKQNDSAQTKAQTMLGVPKG